MALLAGAVPVVIPTREANGFKLSAAELKGHIGPRTKALLLEPAPPTPLAASIAGRNWKGWQNWSWAHGLYVISDDIYNKKKIIFDGAKFVNIAMLAPELEGRTFVLNGVSKTYAMTGWRIGYLAGPPERMTEATDLQSQSTSNPASISQKAAVEALRGPGGRGRHGRGIRLAPGRHLPPGPVDSRGQVHQAGGGLLPLPQLFRLLL